MLKYINGERVYRYGDKRSGFTTRGPPQDYYQLRDACLKGGVLFEDPEFIDDLKGCEWRRPTEISKRPKFVVDGISRFDIIQGNLGDCWFLAAVANLTMYPELYQRVVPDDQDFDENYAGIFHFRFWQFGKWVDVVVDDRLPVENGKLKFMCSTTDEFWSPLLEKAFAKLNGSYKVLDGGWTSEAMQIFTGGIRQLDYINQMPFKTILQAYERGSLMGCAKTDIRGREALTFQNLVGSHAYSITKVATATTISKRIVNLLRIRNPWGNEIEWNGPWSDGSVEWPMLPQKERERLGVLFESDGEFWMEYKDFAQQFTIIEFCHLLPDATEEIHNTEKSKKKWVTSMFNGEWVRGVSAGGSPDNKDTFACNPQYLITLVDPDENDDDDLCTMIVSLTKTNPRRYNTAHINIGFHVFKVDNPESVNKPFNAKFFNSVECCGKTSSYVNQQEVTESFRLSPGTYCIVPSTFLVNQESPFAMRVFTESPNDLRENDISIEHLAVCDEQFNTESELEAESEIYKHFMHVAGEDKVLNAEELAYMLNTTNGIHCGFSLESCRQLISMFDEDRSGKMDMIEFSKLAHMLSLWVDAWNRHDLDNSNTLSGFELRNVLTEAGIHVNGNLLNSIMHRYGNDKGELTFSDYIISIVKLNKLYDVFQEKKNKDGKICLNLNEWLDNCITY